MITTDVQHCGRSVLFSANGQLDGNSGRALEQVMDDLSADVRVLMVVVGWQPQTQRFMAEVAGIPGPGSATGERFALVGFRRLIEQRAQAARDLADFDAGWLPRV
ncbi:hypothetical protein [Streptomyces goshikiensis]|uniref:hypothetical protein n=1 Tax=Streptomyces goshikiensis TaxID=1942 RepID=UPI0036DA5CBB